MVRELEGPGPTLYNSSTTVITGPLDLFTTSRSGDIVVPSLGASFLGCAASFAACAARASGVQVVPVSAAAAPMTPLRMRNDRRSTPEGMADSSGGFGNSPSSLGEVGVLILEAPAWDWCRRPRYSPERVMDPPRADPARIGKELGQGIWVK